MKTYDLRDMCIIELDNTLMKHSNWVPADVAQGLYDALNALVMSWDGDGVMILEAVGVARDALAAADGEE